MGVVHNLFARKHNKITLNESQSVNAKIIEDQLIKNVKRVMNDPELMELLSKPKPQKPHKSATNLWKITLKGVYYNYGNRKEAFKEVQKGDVVYVAFDFGNQYDRNALGVFTMTGKLLGYIPKNNKRLIGLVRNQCNKTATIIEKENGKTQWEKNITIEISMI